jgi:hypothetical protein
MGIIQQTSICDDPVPSSMTVPYQSHYYRTLLGCTTCELDFSDIDGGVGLESL